MYPTVKFTINAELDLENLITSLFDHYSKHYLNKLLTDYPDFDNISQYQVESTIEFLGYIKDHFSIDLQTCIAQEYGTLNDNNREIYLKYYFDYNKKFRELLKVHFINIIRY